jgi:YHS domain-containing protein
MTGWVIRILLLILILRALWRLLRGVASGLQGAGGGPTARGRKEPVALSRDPVCGTYVVPGRALPLRDGALVRYFCSERCREEYARTPRTDS